MRIAATINSSLALAVAASVDCATALIVMLGGGVAAALAHWKSLVISVVGLPRIIGGAFLVISWRILASRPKAALIGAAPAVLNAVARSARGAGLSALSVAMFAAAPNATPTPGIV